MSKHLLGPWTGESANQTVGSANVYDRNSGHKPNHHNSRLFGLPPNQLGSSAKRNFDYDFKYPNEDSPGEEGSENARVWMIYNDEAELFDDDMLHGFRDTLDSLLVFAALFSAVVTTLVAQTSTKLEPDHAQITSYLLVEQILLLRANGNLTAINAVPSSLLGPNAMTRSSTDVAINVLFFVSLSLSLSTALFSILVKQWLTAYAAKVPGTPKDVALTRHYRFVGLQKWKLPEIIGVLPLILHSSLWIFVAGLLLFVWQKNSALFSAAAAVLGVTFGLYSISLLLPPFVHDCPYHIPFLDASVRFFCDNIWGSFAYLARLGYCVFHRAVWHLSQCIRLRIPESYPLWPHFYIRSWHWFRRFELGAGRRPGNICAAVIWLWEYSSNPTIRHAAVRSLAGIIPMEAGDDLDYWVWDDNVAQIFAGNRRLDEALWDQLVHTPLPKTLPQLRSAISTTSPTYNTYVRADFALRSWTYFWIKQGKLPKPSFYSRPRNFKALMHCAWSNPSKISRREFIQYILDCEYVWNPRTKSWHTHALDWTHAIPESPLQFIGMHGLAELVEPVSRRADVNHRTDSYNPIEWAAYRGHLDTVKAFVAAGADLSKSDLPLRVASQNGHIEVVEFLLSQPRIEELIARDNGLFDSFSSAIKGGWSDVVQLFLHKGIQISHAQRRLLKDLAESTENRRQETIDMLEQAWIYDPSSSAGTRT
ncbi:hypothetical protein DL96DRAFT_1819811 [Flagelloscypha sp. PMI_526]|nr:hypothetical protein DL96DRAFT_1819811 [Flagelloscypha sp. PMI_526]